MQNGSKLSQIQKLRTIQVSKKSPKSEKLQYWENRLLEVLSPIPILDLLILCWAIEAFRNDRASVTTSFASIPGDPSDHNIRGQFFIPPWNIDAVINERFVCGVTPNKKTRHLDLRVWDSVRKLFNTYSGLSNIDSSMDFTGKDILSAMPRLFWPQYDWQLGFDNSFRISRAWHVYATSEGKKAFATKHSLELETFLKIAFAAYVATDENPFVRTTEFNVIGVTKEEVFKTRKVIGETLGGHVNNARKIRDVDIPRNFRRSTIKERPLVEFQTKSGRVFYIPSRELLLLRITDGLYYDIVQDDNAKRASGEHFEELCFQLLEHYCKPTCEVEREKDTSYGKSADLFIMENKSDSGIIVECKIRRIPQRILTSPDPWRDCEEDFQDIVKGIVQIWRTHDELTAPSKKDMVGMVLLYDPWTVLGNSFFKELFRSANLEADKLSIPERNRISVALVGFTDLEDCLRSYSIHEIQSAISVSTTEKYHGYQLSGVLGSVSKNSKLEKSRFDYNILAKRAVSWWGNLG